MKTETLRIGGIPNERQKLFFASRSRYTAYGGARGGGKSWALRRKLVGLCLRYPSIRCLLIRRSYAELKANHVRPLLNEYSGIITYHAGEKLLSFPNGSSIALGHCATERDTLRYQGQEYDIIAIDEATQLSEQQFTVLKACLRGTKEIPRRMYLTCNPGGIGHAWVKRLFIDRNFRANESPNDYCFIPAQVYDNPVLLSADPTYVQQLETLPPKLREAWLYGRWDVFEGQFLPEFQQDIHVCAINHIPPNLQYFAAMDYGFDLLAVLLIGMDDKGNLFVQNEFCQSNLTLRAAAEAIVRLCDGKQVEYIVSPPDLWNRRQDSGKSGFELMQSVCGMPLMCRADNRRIPGWRVLREYLSPRPGAPSLRISSICSVLIHSLSALLCDTNRPEDAAGEPHEITHAPEALRYAVMSHLSSYQRAGQADRNFRFPNQEQEQFLF